MVIESKKDSSDSSQKEVSGDSTKSKKEDSGDDKQDKKEDTKKDSGYGSAED